MAALDAYVCPACQSSLTTSATVLTCAACGQSYAIADGLPDFVRDDAASKLLPQPAGSPPWYDSLVRLLEGSGGTTLPELVREVSGLLHGVTGRVLDAACGTGTYGHSVASASRKVFGIDLSLQLLREGLAHSAREGIRHIHFARARVESLPFATAWFDAALCCGALHLFAEPIVALREIARTMKPRAALAGVTFTPGDGLFENARRRLEHAEGVRTFEPSEIENDLAAAGFEDFQPLTLGSILVFHARRRTDK